MRFNSLRHLFVAAASAIVLFASGPADAQLFRAYLAINGNDTNPCTLPAPCRLLPAAIAAAADGGEVWMLDSANYNTATVTVTKSVSILAVPGSVGSILATAGPAIDITADNIKVSLRNVVIVPLPGGSATVGVRMTGVSSSLTIENSLIANMPSAGVFLTAGRAKIANTTIRDNGEWGVSVHNGAQAEIFGAQLLGNGSGGALAYGSADTKTAHVSVSDSAISGGPNGVRAYAIVAGAAANAFVTRCTIENTGHALRSDTTGVGTANLAVSGTMVVHNDYGWYQDGAGSTLWSLGNNHIMFNGGSLGSLSAAPLQ